jgi:hypothetical protein
LFSASFLSPSGWLELEVLASAWPAIRAVAVALVAAKIVLNA